MSFDETLVALVEEALEPVGDVSMRKMMGGAMLYCDGLVFALLYGDAIWFKADGDSDALWDAQGCERFTIAFKDGKTETMNYRRAPDDVYDDPDALRDWARLALEAGARSAARKAPRAGMARAAKAPPLPRSGKNAKGRA
ncbi:TfoX/Sxy family protein [Sphingomonas sp.]|uniref:TfoX/Sxy family protein n=1 Tax=Sphingomonas sp. TaxID=28214 RepID=UPI002FC7FA57